MSYPQASPRVVRWCAQIAAVGFAVAALVFLVSAIKAERSGIAFYSSNPRSVGTEQVSRTSAPDKFKESVQLHWFRVTLLGTLCGVSFYFSHRLRDDSSAWAP